MTPRASGCQRNERAPWKVGTTVTPRAPGSLVAASAVSVPTGSSPSIRAIPASHSTIAPLVGIESSASASPSMAWHGPVMRSSVGRSASGTASAIPVAVPVEIIASGPPIPRPSASAARSAAPTTTGVPIGSPSRLAAAAVSPPTDDADGTILGSCSAETPSASSAAGHQPPASRSYSSVLDALDGSVAATPSARDAGSPSAAAATAPRGTDRDPRPGPRPPWRPCSSPRSAAPSGGGSPLVRGRARRRPPARSRGRPSRAGTARAGRRRRRPPPGCRSARSAPRRRPHHHRPPRPPRGPPPPRPRATIPGPVPPAPAPDGVVSIGLDAVATSRAPSKTPTLALVVPRSMATVVCSMVVLQLGRVAEVSRRALVPGRRRAGSSAGSGRGRPVGSPRRAWSPACHAARSRPRPAARRARRAPCRGSS